ncbi:hypothetical protein TcWFU_000858 [Taenia crassiceps]|uniref:Uncharacterized protein n=1 Tax=Taenia crassiceps TaxID=6207 RepID=A0ABR4QJ98_9CEST
MRTSRARASSSATVSTALPSRWDSPRWQLGHTNSWCAGKTATYTDELVFSPLRQEKKLPPHCISLHASSQTALTTKSTPAINSGGTWPPLHFTSLHPSAVPFTRLTAALTRDGRKRLHHSRSYQRHTFVSLSHRLWQSSAPSTSVAGKLIYLFRPLTLSPNAPLICFRFRIRIRIRILIIIPNVMVGVMEWSS